MIFSSGLELVQQFLIKVLKGGKIPYHVAVIMDGNRRYAKHNNMRNIDGHVLGYNACKNMIQWCQELGIGALTVYAFSIENFNRALEETEELLHTIKVQFDEVIREVENSQWIGTCFKFIGDLTLLPKDLRKTITKLTAITTGNNKFQVTVALAYTSKEELTTAVKNIISGVRNNLILPDDVDEELISTCLYTNYIHNPDIVIRTSGETRFSNFLLWQSGTSIIWFVETLWPNFGIWKLMALVFYYQRCHKDVFNCPSVNTNMKVQRFVDGLNKSRMKQLIEPNIIEFNSR